MAEMVCIIAPYEGKEADTMPPEHAQDESPPKEQVSTAEVTFFPHRFVRVVRIPFERGVCSWFL